jgi:hypothetical protein
MDSARAAASFFAHPTKLEGRSPPLQPMLYSLKKVISSFAIMESGAEDNTF